MMRGFILRITLLAVVLVGISSLLACSSDPFPDAGVTPSDPVVEQPAIPDEPDAENTELPNIEQPDISDVPDADEPAPAIPANDNENSDPPVDVPEHIHNAVVIDEIPANCTDNGRVSCFFCEGCDSYFSDCDCSVLLEDISIPMLGHDFGEQITDVSPSCEQSGSSSRHCSRCDERSDIRSIPELGHDMLSRTLSEPDCNTFGIILHYCSRCSFSYEQNVEPSEHSFVTEVIPPTCSSDGCSRHTCSVCGYGYDSDNVDALGHDWSEWEVITSPTCTAEGLKRRVCLRDCGHTDSGSIPKSPHVFSDTYSYDDTKHWKDSVCGCELTADEHEHVLADNKCECGYKLSIFLFELTDDGKGYTVKGLIDTTVTNLVIPEEYSGKPVTEIASNAFENNKTISDVTIPKSVVLIGSNAFKGCDKLKNVTFTNENKWYTANSANGKGKTSIIVTNKSANAKALTNTYKDKYWLCL